MRANVLLSGALRRQCRRTSGRCSQAGSRNRPKFAYSRLIHENCERRAHFEAAFPRLEAVWLETSAGEDQVLLLTKRPTRVAEVLPYGDARPRTVDTLSEANFIATRKRSLEIFQREVRR